MDDSVHMGTSNEDLIRINHQINHQIPRNNNKIKGYGFVFLIIVGVGGIVTGGVGTFSTLSQVNAIVLMAAGYGGGITCVVIGIVGYKNMRVGVGLDGLIAQAHRSGPDFHREALVFARTVLDQHPEVRASDFDWGVFARRIHWDRFGQGGFWGIDGTPVNEEISKLHYIFNTHFLPRYNRITENSEDPLAQEDARNHADAVMKLTYAITCLTCDDMHDMKRRFGEHMCFGHQSSYQYRWIAWHTRVYQFVRHASNKPEYVQCFYQENTLQSEWRQLFNSHCDYVFQSGTALGDHRYDDWFSKDISKTSFKQLNPRHLPT